jgi:hypothetical protein
MNARRPRALQFERDLTYFAITGLRLGMPWHINGHHVEIIVLDLLLILILRPIVSAFIVTGVEFIVV